MTPNGVSSIPACWRYNCTGDVLHPVELQQTVIDSGEWASSGLDTETLRDVSAAAPETGYDRPECDPSDDVDQIAVLRPRFRCHGSSQCPVSRPCGEAPRGARVSLSGVSRPRVSVVPQVGQSVIGNLVELRCCLADDPDRHHREQRDRHQNRSRVLCHEPKWMFVHRRGSCERSTGFS